MFSGIFFLSQYYNHIFFLCKDKYYPQIKYFFDNIDINITIISFDSNNENESCKKIILNNYYTSDILICGLHKSYLSNKITHPELLSGVICNNISNFNLPERFSFIKMFYCDINLNLNIYINYFHFIHNNELYELYKKISNYNIIFLHTLSSMNELNLDKQIESYLSDTNYLIICANKNFYDISHEKYLLANDYIFLQTVFHYYYLILNAEIIHVIDSSISCIVLPLFYKKELKSKNVNIYNRDTFERIDLVINH